MLLIIFAIMLHRKLLCPLEAYTEGVENHDFKMC